jgi:hypothetical protein
VNLQNFAKHLSHTLDPTKRPRAIRTRLRKSGLSAGHRYVERVRKICKSASLSDFCGLGAVVEATAAEAAGLVDVEDDLD